MLLNLSAQPWKTMHEAFRKHASGELISENWKDNYMKSAANYFNSLMTSYEFCQQSLMSLSIAATKKTRTQLIDETQKVINRYLKVHSEHLGYRISDIEKLDYLPSFNAFLSDYNTKNILGNANENSESDANTTFKISGDPKRDFQKIKSIANSQQPISQASVVGCYEHYARQGYDAKSQYYAGRFFSITTSDIQKEKAFYEKTLSIKPDFFKAKYRLSEMAFKQGNLTEAKKLIEEATSSYEEKADSFGIEINSNLFHKMKNLKEKIVQKMASESTLTTTTNTTTTTTITTKLKQ